ncbi:MAG: Alpha/beta hydrolase [Betaproteobacteria bacterium]|nr:Alpha/beta hydrolase [Betaproteobacteria bacterium]
MKRDHVLCLDSRGFHRVRYYEWGAPDNDRVVVCVHGLTRNGRDFDFLAQSLAGDFRVVCPDVAGRGESDWLAAKTDYAYPQYLSDLTALIARVTAGEAKTVYWVGTSMGALAGIMMAAMPNTPVARLVVNDAGMFIPKAALERIGRYVGKDPRFASLDALETHLRCVAAPFGPLTDEQWRHLNVHSAKQHPDGSWGHLYDPAIGSAFQGELKDVDLSAYWDAIRCPALILRGAESDILLRETAEAMTHRGPKAELVEFAGVGHAPMLLDDAQASVVRAFLLEPARSTEPARSPSEGAPPAAKPRL